MHFKMIKKIFRMHKCLIWISYFKVTMPEVCKFDQFTTDLQPNEFLGSRGNLYYSLDLKTGQSCQ